MRGYVPLPAFRAPDPIDFSGLNSGLDALGKSMERNRLLDQQKEIGKALQGGGTQSQSSQTQQGGNNRLLSSSPAQYGANSVVDRIIGVESGGNPNAKNPNSSATGSGQFINSTWLSTLKSTRPDLAAGKSDQELLAMRSDPNLSREMTGAYASQNAGALTKGGFEATPGNTYLAHFAGPGGATAVLKADPNTPVRQVLGERVVQANPFLANMTAGDLRNWADRKMGGGTAATPQPRAAAPGLNYGAAVNTALRQGNLDVAMRLQDAQRSEQDTAYNRARQERQDALTNESTRLSIDKTRQDIEEAAQKRVAGVAQTIAAETDPARKAAMWQKFVAAGGGKVAQTLQQYGIDPNDVEAGSRLIIAEARGLTETKPAEFKTFKSDEGIYRGGPAGVEVIREPGGAGIAASGLDPVAEKERQKAFGKGIGEAQVSLPTALNAGEAVLRSVDAARADPGLSRVTGPIQSWLPNLTETAARAQSRVDQLQGQTFLQAFQALKGGGTITEQEGAKAQAALNRLGSLGMGDADYLTALDEFRKEVVTLYDLAQQKAGIPPEQRRQLPQLNIQPTPPAGAKETVRVNSPEEAMRLPSGTQFMTPDGRIKVRP